MLEKEHNDFYSQFIENEAIKDREYRAPQEDGDGWSKWQLWDLMHRLGKYCRLGMYPPFETVIKIGDLK